MAAALGYAQPIDLRTGLHSRLQGIKKDRGHNPGQLRSNLQKRLSRRRVCSNPTRCAFSHELDVPVLSSHEAVIHRHSMTGTVGRSVVGPLRGSRKGHTDCEDRNDCECYNSHDYILSFSNSHAHDQTYDFRTTRSVNSVSTIVVH